MSLKSDEDRNNAVDYNQEEAGRAYSRNEFVTWLVKHGNKSDDRLPPFEIEIVTLRTHPAWDGGVEAFFCHRFTDQVGRWVRVDRVWTHDPILQAVEKKVRQFYYERLYY